MNNRIAILVVAIVAILGVVVGVIDQLRPKRKPIAEDLVMGRKEVREAFRVATPHQGAIPEGISTLFTNWGTNFANEMVKMLLFILMSSEWPRNSI
jgi:hypothetical protein